MSPPEACSPAIETAAPSQARQRFLRGLARALGGAIIFSMPMFMTMEMWELGATMSRARLALLLVLLLPLLVGLSHYVGFEDTFDWREDLRDSFVALAVALAASALVLLLLSVIEPEMSADEIVGKIALQAVSASIGAMLAQSQFGQKDAEEGEQERDARYGGEIFLMAVGALFLSFSIAPTEEVTLLAAMMTKWHMLLLVLMSIVVMHSFVYAVDFRGQESSHPKSRFSSVFFRFTIAGYAVTLMVSFYVLWTFGHLDGVGTEAAVMQTVVLGFPGATGAAAARLIL